MTHRLRARRSSSLAACARLALGFVILLPSVLPNSALAKNTSPERLTYVVRAVRAARPAVVNIQGQKLAAPTVQTTSAAEAPRAVNGMGTGVVVDERGYIV